MKSRRITYERTLEETREAFQHFAAGSTEAGRAALRCVWKNRKAILLSTWRGVKIILLIVSVLSEPQSAEAALQNLKDLPRD